MRVPEYDEPIRVRWYPAEAPAGSYELTDYSSSNWDEEPRSYDPALGEQSTTRDPWQDWRWCLRPPFDPTVIDGLLFWFRDPPDGTLDGGNVTTVPDITGNGFDLTETAPGFQTIWNIPDPSDGSKPSIQVSATTDLNFGALPNAGTDFTVMVRYARIPTADISPFRVLIDLSGGYLELVDNLASGLDKKSIAMERPGVYSGNTSFDAVFDTPLVVTYRRNDRSVSGFVNGKKKLNVIGAIVGSNPVTTFTTAFQTISGLDISARIISEMICWNRALSDNEVAAMNEYMALRYAFPIM
jgi:hypothetical protein